jgi:hypothetical protein
MKRLLASPAGRAAPIPIGTLSFDVFIPPAKGFPGVNAFNISNFRGNSTCHLIFRPPLP